jgi:hypothetical protein
MKCRPAHAWHITASFCFNHAGEVRDRLFVDPRSVSCGRSSSWPPSVDVPQTDIDRLKGALQFAKDFPWPFYRHPTCPEIVFLRLPSSGGAEQAPASGFPCSATASVSESVPPHLHQTCQAIFAVQNVEECPHDLTPLLSHGWSVGAVYFWVSSRARENSFVGARFVSFRHGRRNGFTKLRVGGRSMLRPRCRSTPIKEKPRPGGRFQDGARAHKRSATGSTQMDRTTGLPRNNPRLTIYLECVVSANRRVNVR